MGLRRPAAAALLLALLPVATAAAARSRTQARVPDWAAPQIQVVVSRGLMGTRTPAGFRPNAPLTRQALANLAFGLVTALTPPPLPEPVPADPTIADPTTDPTATDPTATDPTVPDPTAVDPAVPDPTTTDPTVTEPTVTDPTVTEPVPPDPAETTPAPAAPAPAPPPAPPKVADPGATVSMAGLDARLVSSLGLSGAASEFAQGARSAGLEVPGRFGTEVVARLLGLRVNHPAALDWIERLPGDPATRAEAAYSAAQIIGFGWLGNSWQTAAVQSLADSFALPQLSAWQRRILDTAVARIGMPYIWGGTSDGAEAPFGVRSRGGYDCSGFVWRVYKLQGYSGEGDLGSVLRGRTTFDMSVEVPASERIPFAELEPADVIFFGSRGPRSTGPEVDHMGIYLGNGWFIHSSEYGVALAQLTGWYRHEFAWGRRPLREAGLAG